MYVVVVDIAVRAGSEQEVARLFTGPFTTAISAQEGFRSVALLKPAGGLDYLLVITFTDPSLQQKWVATDLHGEVWSALEAQFDRYQVRSFTALSSHEA